MTVSILGTEYTLCVKKYDEDPYFKKNGCDGYCDGVLHEIVVCDLTTYPSYEDETPEYCALDQKSVVRHEIVHAFFNESGLKDSANVWGGAWCRNEECVDWIANQHGKMHAAFLEADAL